MDNSTKYFISLLSTYINRQKPAVENNIDWNEVYKLAKIHNVSGIVYMMSKEIEDEYKSAPEIPRQMKKDFISTAMRADIQESEMAAVIKALNEAKISHVLMKGYVTRNYYPIKEMRTMGDIDILIKPDDREASHDLLQALGYIPGYISGEVWDYTKGAVHLEIHTQIMYHNMHNGTDYIGYFSDAWKHTVETINPYTFEFDTVYHFLFLMVHMAKHFDGSGCGIRMIMDIVVYLLYFKESLDWSHINKEIEKLNLVLFSKNIYILCNLWFGTNFDFQLPTMNESFYIELSQYILSAGTFGFYYRNQKARPLRNEYMENKVDYKWFPRRFALINLYRKMLFPGYNVMSSVKYYSFINNRPLLLPLGWIYRFIRCTLVKPNESFSFFNNVFHGKEESKKQYRIISDLGL